MAVAYITPPKVHYPYQRGVIQMTTPLQGSSYKDEAEAFNRVVLTLQNKHVSLNPEYIKAEYRIQNFTDVSHELRKQALKLLRIWARQVFAVTGVPLPAPRVFGTTRGTVEFEWELPERELWLTLENAGQIAYLKEQTTLGQEWQEEGDLEIRDVPRELSWLVGA